MFSSPNCVTAACPEESRGIVARGGDVPSERTLPGQIEALLCSVPIAAVERAEREDDVLGHPQVRSQDRVPDQPEVLLDPDGFDEPVGVAQCSTQGAASIEHAAGVVLRHPGHELLPRATGTPRSCSPRAMVIIDNEKAAFTASLGGRVERRRCASSSSAIEVSGRSSAQSFAQPDHHLCRRILSRESSRSSVTSGSWRGTTGSKDCCMARMASCRLSRNHNARNQSRSAETHTSSLCTITPGSATAQRALMYEASARSRARAVAGPEGVGHRSRLRPHQSMRTRSSSAASAARAAARAAGNACRPPASYRCRARSMSSVESFGRSSRARRRARPDAVQV